MSRENGMKSVQVRTILAARGVTHIGSPRSYVLLTYVYLCGRTVARPTRGRNETGGGVALSCC